MVEDMESGGGGWVERGGPTGGDLLEGNKNGSLMARVIQPLTMDWVHSVPVLFIVPNTWQLLKTCTGNRDRRAGPNKGRQT